MLNPMEMVEVAKAVKEILEMPDSEQDETVNHLSNMFVELIKYLNILQNDIQPTIKSSGLDVVGYAQCILVKNELSNCENDKPVHKSDIIAIMEIISNLPKGSSHSMTPIDYMIDTAIKAAAISNDLDVPQDIKNNRNDIAQIMVGWQSGNATD